MPIHKTYDDDFKEFITKQSKTMPFDEISKIHKVPIHLIRYWRYGFIYQGDDLKKATKVEYKLKKPTNNFRWVVKYPVQIESNSITNASIFITNERAKIDCYVQAEPNLKGFSVSPAEPYQVDTYYYLHITKDIRLKNQLPVKPVTVRFMIVDNHKGQGFRFMREIIDGYTLQQEIETGNELEFESEEKPQSEPPPKRSLFNSLIALGAAYFVPGYDVNPIQHEYEWKVSLNWEGRCMTDLDLHGFLPDGTHVYFWNKHYAKDTSNVVWLDYDYIFHLGRNDRITKPEIITLLGKPAAQIKIGVNNFNAGSLKQDVVVEVFRKNQKKQNISVFNHVIPATEFNGMCRFVPVCIIDLEKGTIESC